jgi:hypothetical protein
MKSVVMDSYLSHGHLSETDHGQLSLQASTYNLEPVTLTIFLVSLRPATKEWDKQTNKLRGLSP